MEDAGAHQGSPSTWSECEAQGGDGADLASLPDGVRAIVEECRAQSKQTSGAAAAAAKEAPYPCRMYEEAGPGEEDMLQLQWMRVDVRGEACYKQVGEIVIVECTGVGHSSFQFSKLMLIISV